MPIIATRALASARGFGFAGGAPFLLTISSNQTNANLATLATAAGWNGSSRLIATINSGVYCSSNSTGTPGLTVNGSFPGGVELINQGFIIGMGGAGGAGPAGVFPNSLAGSNGSSGGLALSVSSAISITNNGTIGGGGGGGGGGTAGRSPQTNDTYYFGGGGGGGGRSGATNSSGGARGYAKAEAASSTGFATAGGDGTSSAAGTGGAGIGSGFYPGTFAVSGLQGGNGGSWGASGGNGSDSSPYDLNTFSQQKRGPYSGGAGGGAVTGNSNITWIATGTRLGAIS